MGREHELRDATGFDVITAMTVLSAIGCTFFPKNHTQMVKEYAACDLFKKISVSMPSEPLYTLHTGQCSAYTDLDNEQDDGIAFYADPSCQQEVDYKPSSFFSYCKNNLLDPVNHHYIGNAAEWANDGGVQFATLGKNSKWTLSHGPSLDVLALSPKGNHRPFMKQVEYRDIDGCHLEMRVYKKNIQEKNLKPLILIHGGAWKYRGFGAIGGEVLVSQFTEMGGCWL